MNLARFFKFCSEKLNFLIDESIPFICNLDLILLVKIVPDTQFDQMSKDCTETFESGLDIGALWRTDKFFQSRFYFVILFIMMIPF